MVTFRKIISIHVTTDDKFHFRFTKVVYIFSNLFGRSFKSPVGVPYIGRK
jgi:hypothetical protein